MSLSRDRTLMPSSRNWAVETSPGASVSRHIAFCVLGESDDVADGFRAGQDHDKAIQTKGNAAMGRRTVFQGAQQEAELVFGLLGLDAEHGEHGPLGLAVMDADGAAADLAAVEH